MRRTDREITDAEKITQIIQTCHCCRLGFCDNGAVYIVPLNFGYAEENGKRVFYFHSAKSGRKLDLIAGTPSVGFELDVNYALVEGLPAYRPVSKRYRHGARFLCGGGRAERSGFAGSDAAQYRKRRLDVFRRDVGFRPRV